MNQFVKEKLWTQNFFLATIINLVLFLSFQMFPSALPPYLKSLGASDEILGWITAIAMISTMMTRPIAGIALDKLGRRSVTLAGLLLMLLATLALYFFPVVGIVLVLRFMHGLGWGISNTAMNTVAADYVPVSRMGEGMAFFSLSASLAMAVAPAIALSMSGSHMIMTGSAFIALCFLLATVLRYKPLEKTAGKTEKKASPYERNSFLPAFIICMVTFTYGLLITFLAVYAAERGIANIGPYFTVYALVMLMTRPIVGRIVDRHGFGITVVPGVLLIALALILLSQATSMIWFLISAAFYGIGQGATHTSLMTMSIIKAPKNRLGAANATYNTGFDAGMGLGSVCSGILASAVGYGDTFLYLSFCPVLAGIIYLIASRNGAGKK